MIEQKSFTPYPEHMLPKGFKYPESYLKLSKSTDTIIPDKELGFPWGFDSYGTQGAELSYKYRNSYLSDAFNLIPFAHCYEWGAYFDGSDCSGDPRVIVIDRNELPFHDFRNNFDDWLADAINIAWYYG